MHNSPRSSEDKIVVRYRQVNKLQSSLLNNIDCTIHKQPIMLRHCSKATATEYSMLSWRQDAAMTLEYEVGDGDQKFNHLMV